MVEQLYAALTSAQVLPIVSKWSVPTHIEDTPWPSYQSFATSSSTRSQLVLSEEQLFDVLATELEKETLSVSSPRRMINCSTARVLKKLPHDVVFRGAMKRIDSRPILWMSIMQQLAMENPVPIDDRGHVARMIEHWRNWGREHAIP